MTVVVFDHTPHDGTPFLLQFLAGTNLAAFFFISGYLKKPSISYRESLKKYFHCLIIPYFIYNVVFYPYWLGKFYIQNGSITIIDAIKPIIGTILGQLDSIFSTELNGVTWFLLSLFVMHVITDYCNKHKHREILMLGISIVAMILYGANKYYHFAPYLTFHGLVRCIPFFFLGNLMRQSIWLKEVKLERELTISIIALTVSLLLFYWHINENTFILHIALYFIVNLISIFAVICLWRCINNFRSHIVVWISIGTMMIFGFHRIIVGVICYCMEEAFHLHNIIYTCPKAATIALATEFLLLPSIYFTYKYCPILLGKKK